MVTSSEGRGDLRGFRDRLHERPGPIDVEALQAAGTGVGLDDLMVRLLPEAARYAITPLSGFPVGAVLEAEVAGGRAIYLGSNIELAHQSPALSIHAEQAAVVNAWMHGATRFRRLTVSSPPCGYCRQFLHELNAADLTLVVGASRGVTAWALDELLPAAFGPADLGVDASLDPRAADELPLRLEAGADDPMVASALAAARRSYAPYTGNLAGACVESHGGLFTGRGIENAAYNPSLTALHVALAFMHMNLPLGARREVRRAVLVERPTRASQRDLAATVLRGWAPGIELEYHAATLAGATPG